MPNPKLEIACFNTDSAVIAELGGADRIELCKNREEGGTTPDIETILEVRHNCTIDLYIMVRPRGGNFVYSAEEFELMKETILSLKHKNVDGFVFGMLHTNGTVDITRNKELVELAKPLPCTFHRAFDQVTDLLTALEDVISCGFESILTSGRHATAIEGIIDLELLLSHAKHRIHIMPGGGIRSENIKVLREKLNALFFHSSAIIGSQEFAVLNEVAALKKHLHV